MTAESLSLEPKGARDLTKEVMRLSGEPLTSCYQCRRCAAGCPVGEDTGYQTPDRLIRLVLLGDRKGALSNDLVWRCVSCYTCGTRCPNNIHTSKVNETLKRMALQEHIQPTIPEAAFFHQAFIKSSLLWGRMNEMGLMLAYELSNLWYYLKQRKWQTIRQEIDKQIKFGLSMFKFKRMHFKWFRCKGRKELKRLEAKSKTVKVDSGHGKTNTILS